MITIITGAICLFLGAAAGIMLMAWVVAHRLGPRDLDSYGGTMSAVLTFPEGVGKEQVKEYVDLFRADYTGVENMRKVGGLGGGAEYKPMSVTQEQADFIASKTITGEVASDVVEKTEPAADAPPLINVFWPDSSFPQETEVGQYTTYGELIADYLTASELDDDPAGYIVVGMASNHECSPKARILEGAYGHLFAVCRRGQTCDTCGRSCNVRQNHGQLVTGCHGRDWSAAVTCDTCAAPCALKLDEGSEKTGCGGNGWKGAAEEPAA